MKSDNISMRCPDAGMVRALVALHAEIEHYHRAREAARAPIPRLGLEPTPAERKLFEVMRRPVPKREEP